MQKLIVGVTTLVAVVLGFVLFTSLDSPAQEIEEDDGSGNTTTTTVVEDEAPFGFGLRGDMAAAIEDFLACLEEQGIEVPDSPDRGFFFDFGSDQIEGLAGALETCGLPGLRFGGDWLEPFEGELPEGFPFHGLPEDFLDELPEDFLDGLPEDFRFGPRFHFELPDDFLDEFPEGFPFGEGFEFHGPPGLDRDALARCLFESGSLDTFDDVRAGLDECLPEDPAVHFRHGPHHFGFDFDEPEEESSSV